VRNASTWKKGYTLHYYRQPAPQPACAKRANLQKRVHLVIPSATSPLTNLCMARQPPRKGTPCAAIDSFTPSGLSAAHQPPRNGTPCAAIGNLPTVQLVSSAPTTKKWNTLRCYRQPPPFPACEQRVNPRRKYPLRCHRQPVPCSGCNQCTNHQERVHLAQTLATYAQSGLSAVRNLQ